MSGPLRRELKQTSEMAAERTVWICLASAPELPGTRKTPNQSTSSSETASEKKTIWVPNVRYCYDMGLSGPLSCAQWFRNKRVGVLWNLETHYGEAALYFVRKEKLTWLAGRCDMIRPKMVRDLGSHQENPRNSGVFQHSARILVDTSIAALR